MDDSSIILDEDQFSVPSNPSKYSFLSSLGLDQDVHRRLTLHLDRVVSGDSSIYTSAIGKDRDPKQVLASWTAIFDANRHRMNRPLLDMELSNLDKFGARSISKPWSERKPDVERYYNNKMSKLPYDIYSGLKDLNRGTLRPLTVEKTLNFLKNNTNSGLPYYTKKGKVKDRTSRKLEYLLSRRDPCILFTRTQEGGKTRNVWGYPCADTLEEMRYYKPLLAYQSKLPWRSALLGPDEVSKHITTLIRRAQDRGDTIFSGDVSAFDANFAFELSKASFYYIKQLFQYDSRSGLDRILDRFTTIELLTPDGIRSGYHGVPSGSTFTNEVDSIGQYMVLNSIDIDHDCFQIQGDDLVLCTPEGRLQTIFERYHDSGLPFNYDKCSVADDHCFYLQNLFHVDYTKNGVIWGIYSTYRALNRIIYQERWSDFEDYDLDGIDYYSIRTISILENCKHHPLFRNLVEFVYKLDKYSLKFSQKAVKKYDTMLNNSSGVGGFLYNQYSDNIRGINSFETVKIIKQLSKL